MGAGTMGYGMDDGSRTGRDRFIVMSGPVPGGIRVTTSRDGSKVHVIGRDVLQRAVRKAMEEEGWDGCKPQRLTGLAMR